MLGGESIDMVWTFPQLVIVDVLAEQGLQNIAPALDAHSMFCMEGTQSLGPHNASTMEWKL